uniref:Glycerophosphodiester phosphodiesterase 1-like n=1 Tax=Sinocyclocheilus grahami TaxID=75366 RepID=A0A672TEK0_SINGR
MCILTLKFYLFTCLLPFAPFNYLMYIILLHIEYYINIYFPFFLFFNHHHLFFNLKHCESIALSVVFLNSLWEERQPCFMHREQIIKTKLKTAGGMFLLVASSDRFRGEKVPTLQEAVEECIKRQLTIYFDVKGHPDEAAAALKELFQKYPVLYNTSIVCSFEPKVIYRMRQADPNVVTALTHRPWSLSRFGDGTPRFSSAWKHHWMQVLDVLLDWAHHHLLWNLCGVSAFLVQKNFISPDYVQYWAARGVEVVGWTVNTAVEKQYYQQLLKINYITDSLVEDCEPHY